jgi:hypothetical protein
LKLDSEQQRQLLLTMLVNTHIEGTLEGVSQALPEMRALVETVQRAQLEQPKEGNESTRN